MTPPGPNNVKGQRDAYECPLWVKIGLSSRYAFMSLFPEGGHLGPLERPGEFVSSRLELAVIQPIDIEQAFCE
jgi:hypothetical protein